MPVPNYGVLKGKAVKAKREDDLSTPHYQILIEADTKYRIAVNVMSSAGKPEVLYLVDDAFTHPVTKGLCELTTGFTPLQSRPGGLALDFIRANLFDHNDMRPLPHNLPGPDNDLSDKLAAYIERAVREPDAVVYALGSRWGAESKPDQIFGFTPGNGIHNIHMNQGNSPEYTKDDGIWRDGSVLINYPSTNQWVGIFLAFQNQAWQTDDEGHPIVPPEHVIGEQAVRIVAAMVNPTGAAPEKEWVTVFNASPQALPLEGWQIEDRMKHTVTLSGIINAGEMLKIPLPPTVQLGNKGGLITLLDKQGLKVDGVSYTEEQAKKEGWAVVF